MKARTLIAAGIMTVGLGIGTANAVIENWSTTASNNTDTNISPEGMAGTDSPSTIDNSYREALAQVRRWAEQIVHNVYAATTGASDPNTMRITPAIAPASLVQGSLYAFKAPTTNTGAVTLEVNTLGALTMFKHHDQDLAAGDIEENQMVLVQFDGVNFQMLSRSAIAPGSLDNVVEDTTPQLGGDLDLNGNNLDFPTTANISDVLDEDNMASDSATALATQQSIKAFVDSQDHGGSTITAGTFNQLSPYATGQVDTQAHGLGRVDWLHAELECINTGGCNGTWDFGDRVTVASGQEGGSTEPAFFIVVDGTNVIIHTNSSNVPRLINESTGAGFSITAGNWALNVTPFKLD